MLQEHVQSMHLYSPPESIHVLDADGLRKPEITFWSIWENEELLGCGALRELDSAQGEVKSMRTATAHRRKGVARRMLEHLLIVARERGYQRLYLETGSEAAFVAARNLYASFGFEPCGPFGEYVLDPYSAYMTMELGSR